MPSSEPQSDSTDDIVDAYYDTGAYLTDPTRPGAVIEPQFISDHERAVLDRLASIDATKVVGAEAWVQCGNGRTSDSIITPSANAVVRWIRGEMADG